MSDEPGFDFIKLTRPQWRHLAGVQREHGIPWHNYIQILIQRDMSRTLAGEEIRPAPMEGKDPLTADGIAKLVEKITELINRPVQAIPTYYPTITEGAALNIVEDEHIKPSKFKPVKPFAAGTRMTLMEELHEKLGLPPPKERKIEIQISEYVTIEAPNPPKKEEE